MGFGGINKKYYWYCGDILDYDQLCKATLADTGESPYLPYVDKYWKASIRAVLIYRVESYAYKLKSKINNLFKSADESLQN